MNMQVITESLKEKTAHSKKTALKKDHYKGQALIASLSEQMVFNEKNKFEAMITPCQKLLPNHLEDDQVLVNVTRTSICQTDRRVLAQQKNHFFSDSKICLGHEGGGIIKKAGSTAKKNWLINQKVVLLPHYSCLKCDYCRRGETNLCPEMKHMGIHKNGVFSNYMVYPERCLYPVPEIFKDDLLPLVEPLSCVIRGWKKLGKFPLKGSVAIYGAGPMGVLSALYCQKNFPHLSIELIEINSTRRVIASEITGIKVVSKATKKYNLSLIFSSDFDAYQKGVENSTSHGIILAFSGINSDQIICPTSTLYEKIHRQEEIQLLSNSTKKMVGTSGYNREDIADAVGELILFPDCYSKVQNATLERFLSSQIIFKEKRLDLEKPAIIELLNNSSEFKLNELQNQILKVLVKMD